MFWVKWSELETFFFYFLMILNDSVSSDKFHIHYIHFGEHINYDGYFLRCEIECMHW